MLNNNHVPIHSVPFFTFLCSHSLQNHLSVNFSTSAESIGGSTQEKWNALGQASQHKNWPTPPQASQTS